MSWYASLTDSPGVPETDDRTRALARLGAAIALGAPAAMLEWLGDSALAGGATGDDIIGTLVAVAPIVGSARIVKAIPEIALAVGYEVDRALEDSG